MQRACFDGIITPGADDDFVYQAVVDQKYLEEADRALLGGELHELEPWDPFGTLAD